MIRALIGRWPRLAIRRKGGKISTTSRIVSLNAWSWLNRLEIGDHVYIGPSARLFALGGITIDEGSIAGPNLTIYTSNHDFFGTATIPYSNETISKKNVAVGKGCWLGDSVILLPGTELGDHCLVGAGSVVRGTFPAGSILLGNPAKVVKTLSKIQLAAKHDGLARGAFLLAGRQD
ncbi:hypothetical protein GCM10007094_10750 [Pseudovibrio japonicus]|uniref:Acyltransferase n=1 Tax=Pseudovibrio japonicus TaxID=366534 RepID=A0ABQ3E634_9HYPH|nr:acyltransferase [Pseudovibrio japonicus]GHB24552.1 hypothetical protein GCM10007094_10750 [Pseudovibrio japonicus]